MLHTILVPWFRDNSSPQAQCTVDKGLTILGDCIREIQIHNRPTSSDIF